jgi:peptidase M50-like protein
MPFVTFIGLVLALGIAGLVAFGPHAAKAPINPPKPARIAGDGTNRFLDGLGLLVGIGGIVVGNNLWDRWAHAQDLPIMYGSIPFLWIAFAALITTAIHEFGHTTAGLAFGMRLRAFIVGPFQWRIRDGSWKFQFLPTKFFSAGGATAVVPTNPKHSGWHDICMIAAGPLASLLSGLIALEIALAAKGSLYAQYWELFAMIATFSLVGVAVNLIPFRPESSYSDGAQIYQLLRGGAWADLHKVMNMLGSTGVTPLRPRDYDIQATQRASATFKHGQQALLLRLMAVDYFIDRSMIPQACESLVEAESIYHESASDIPADLYTVLIFDSAFLRRDAFSARQWWERMEAKKPTHFAVDYWLAQSALFWTENRLEEAREAWTKGNAMAQQRPSAGVYEYDRYRYALLRQVLDEAPVAG